MLTATAQASVGPLPDGTYRYEVFDSGKASGTSVLRVSRSGGDLVIEEHASPMEENEFSRRTLDPTTFALRSYSDISDGNQVAALAIHGDAATLTQDTATTQFSARPNAPFVVFDFAVGLFFHLPATEHGAGTPSFTVLAVGGEKAAPMSVSASSAKRPAAVAPTDASLDLTLGHEHITLWYEPQTFLLDECDLQAERISFKRLINLTSGS